MLLVITGLPHPTRPAVQPASPQPFAVGATVVRKADKRRVRGRVLSLAPRRRDGRWRCRVAWEGATTGTRRFSTSGAWAVTTTVLADTLELADA